MPIFTKPCNPDLRAPFFREERTTTAAEPASIEAAPLSHRGEGSKVEGSTILMLKAWPKHTIFVNRGDANNSETILHVLLPFMDTYRALTKGTRLRKPLTSLTPDGNYRAFAVS